MVEAPVAAALTLVASPESVDAATGFLTARRQGRAHTHTGTAVIIGEMNTCIGEPSSWPRTRQRPTGQACGLRLIASSIAPLSARWPIRYAGSSPDMSGNSASKGFHGEPYIVRVVWCCCHDHFFFRVLRILVVDSTGRPLAQPSSRQTIDARSRSKRRDSHMVGDAGQVILNTKGVRRPHWSRRTHDHLRGFQESLDRHKSAFIVAST